MEGQQTSIEEWSWPLCCLVIRQLNNKYYIPIEGSERRTRKLLLHKIEIKHLNDDINKQGYTLIPLEVYLKNNHAKVLLGVCKGKHTYDKRQTIKERDLKREARNV